MKRGSIPMVLLDITNNKIIELPKNGSSFYRCHLQGNRIQPVLDTTHSHMKDTVADIGTILL